MSWLDFYLLWWWGAAFFWLPCLGACLLLLLHELTGGAWMAPLRTSLKACARALPIASLGFLPLLTAEASIFYWFEPRGELLAHLARERGGFLNEMFFILRNIVYACVFIVLSRRAAHGGRLHAGPGLLLLVLSVFFFVVDWWMIREPGWWSSGFPFTVMLASALAALAWGILSSDSALADASVKVRRDVGSLLLAAIVLATYGALMEFIITYAGDLPRKRALYSERSGELAAWLLAGGVLVGGVGPFFNLLRAQAKVRIVSLRISAAGVLVMLAAACGWFMAPLHPAESPATPSSEQKEGVHD